MGRRSNGEGSILKRDDGRYMVRFSVNGKRKTIYTKSHEEAVLTLRQALYDIASNTYVEPNKEKLESWLNEWLEVYAFPSVKQSTYVSYRGYINNHIVPELGNIRMSSLNTGDLQLFFNAKQRSGARKDRRTGGLSAKTLRNMYNMLNASLEQAILVKKIAINPIKGVKLPKLQSNEMRVLTLKEQQKIMEVATTGNDLNAFGIILTLYTGLRIGEVVGLKWKDLDYEKKIIKVRRTVSRLPKVGDLSEDESKTEIVIGSPKTKQSIRDIPVSENVWNMLMDYKNKQKRHFKEYDKKLCSDDYIFCGEGCNVVEPTTYASVFERAVKRAHIDNANYHCLRHTFATRALESGIDIKVLSSLLGHAQCSTTLDKYGHSLPDHKRHSMERVDLFINNNLTYEDN